jgi:chloramphenicol O-acetyltransferase
MNTRIKSVAVGLCGIACLALATTLFTGCATIPRESVKLSENLGTMISNSRASYINLVNHYFDQRVEAMRTFALNEYKPAFIKNIQKRLKEQNQEFTFDRYDQAVTRVLKKTDEWVAEVEAQRTQVLNEVNAYYDLMTRANESVTSLLRSANQIEEARKKLTGDLEQKGDKLIDFEKLDQQTQAILNKAQKARELLAPGEN